MIIITKQPTHFQTDIKSHPPTEVKSPDHLISLFNILFLYFLHHPQNLKSSLHINKKPYQKQHQSFHHTHTHTHTYKHNESKRNLSLSLSLSLQPLSKFQSPRGTQQISFNIWFCSSSIFRELSFITSLIQSLFQMLFLLCSFQPAPSSSSSSLGFQCLLA